jgi:hypothetical protein
MNREKWNFSYRVDAILAGAIKKVAHHKARLRWWEEQKQEIMAKIRAEGIEIDESLAAASGGRAAFVSNTYGRNPTVQIRNDFVQDLAECVGKIREHRSLADDYAAWVQVLGAQKSDMMHELQHDDWMFFFGVPTPVQLEE